MNELKQIGPFRGEQRPVRDGVYKRRFPFDTKIVFSKYENGVWYDSGFTVEEAAAAKFVSLFQDSQWWGVVNEEA